MTKAVAVVPAGGSGSRMGIRQPKQYLTVGGAPILVLTLRALARCRVAPRAHRGGARRSRHGHPRPAPALPRAAGARGGSRGGRAPGFSTRRIAGGAPRHGMDRRARRGEALHHPGSDRARAHGRAGARRRHLWLARAGDGQAREGLRGRGDPAAGGAVAHPDPAGVPPRALCGKRTTRRSAMATTAPTTPCWSSDWAAAWPWSKGCPGI